MKIVLFFKQNDNEYIKTNKEFLINLGLRFLQSESNYYIISSLMGEILVFICSIIAIILSIKYTDINEETKIDTYSNLFYLLNSSIYICYFSVLGFALFNRSLLTLGYIISMSIILLFNSLDIMKKTIYYLFRFLSIILIICIIVQISLINIF